MKPVFLAACGAKTYETLKNLCLPQEVSDVDYGGIIEKLKTHFKPEPLIIYIRTVHFREKIAQNGRTNCGFCGRFETTERLM